jgi:hypothetical protein
LDPKAVHGSGVFQVPVDFKSTYRRIHRARTSMGIFSDMHEKRRFDSDWEYRELRRMLSEAISGGYVEHIPVMKPDRFSPDEEWYRDKETGEIYSLVGPEEKMRGQWERVDPGDIVGPDEKIQ